MHYLSSSSSKLQLETSLGPFQFQDYWELVYEDVSVSNSTFNKQIINSVQKSPYTITQLLMTD